MRPPSRRSSPQLQPRRDTDGRVCGARLDGHSHRTGGSDSAALDNALEVLELSGRDILHTVMMLAPEAWEKTFAPWTDDSDRAAGTTE